MKKKQCNVCGKLKKLDGGFYFRYANSFEETKYYRADCKECHNKAQRLRRKLKNL